jgi:glycosyltransferase involved in cell wall biosynthesis
MSHGKPVVASRLSGIPEILPEILVEEGDINGLALALESYITNPERRIMDGKRNAQIIREECSDSNLLTMVSAWKDSL